MPPPRFRSTTLIRPDTSMSTTVHDLVPYWRGRRSPSLDSISLLGTRVGGTQMRSSSAFHPADPDRTVQETCQGEQLVNHLPLLSASSGRPPPPSRPPRRAVRLRSSRCTKVASKPYLIKLIRDVDPNTFELTLHYTNRDEGLGVADGSRVLLFVADLKAPLDFLVFFNGADEEACGTPTSRPAARPLPQRL